MDGEVIAMHLIDKSFIRAPKSYIIQSLLATTTVAIILYFVKLLNHEAIVAALGSSAFVVFAMPNATTAQPRRLVGGHVVGLLSGSLCYYAFLTGPLGELIAVWEFTNLFVYALTVGISIFLMAVTNTEHPPASGTALGIVAHTWSYQIVSFVLLSAICLAVVRRLLRSHLRNLF
ncbi:HPP family protein [Chloroflexota bacterium]